MEMEPGDAVVMNGHRYRVEELSPRRSLVTLSRDGERVTTPIRTLKFLGAVVERVNVTLPGYEGAVVRGREDGTMFALLSIGETPWTDGTAWYSGTEVLEALDYDWELVTRP